MTFGQPHFRKPFFEQKKYTWTMKTVAIGDTFHYYFYYLKKGTRNDEELEKEKAALKDINSVFGKSYLQEQLDQDDFINHIEVNDNE